MFGSIKNPLFNNFALFEEVKSLVVYVVDLNIRVPAK